MLNKKNISVFFSLFFAITTTSLVYAQSLSAQSDLEALAETTQELSLIHI